METLAEKCGQDTAAGFLVLNPSIAAGAVGIREMGLDG